MKKVLSIIAMVLCTLAMSAQEKEITKFLGIPVDGSKSEMKQKLIEKGFTPKTIGGEDFLEGEFNGTNVRVFIATNNNKVWRIMVCEKNTHNEGDIKIRFNKLCSQFEKNEKYVSADFKFDQTIPDDEDISHEMLVNNKRYQAAFYQVLDSATIDSIKVPEDIMRSFLSKVGIENPTEEQFETAMGLGKGSIGFDMTSKKLVWFMIAEDYNEYYIVLYYDNKYNEADGEDL